MTVTDNSQLDPAIVWRYPGPSEETVEGAFMDRYSIGSREELYQRSVRDPEWFWASVIEFLDIPFISSPTKIVESTAEPHSTRWFVDGHVNLAHACLSSWENSDLIALIDEREDGSIREWTGKELVHEVRQGAGLLRDNGLITGDRVVLLLPMSAEGIISLLSVAWAGGVSVPVFSGFGVEATALRLSDSGATMVITTAGVTRRGRPVDLVDVARQSIAAVNPDVTFIVWGLDHHNARGTDGIDWVTAATRVPLMHDPSPTLAEDPVLIAYTSGTTGRPKGVVHVHGGLTVKLAQEGAFQLDIHPGDRVAWVTDLGWLMSQWILVAALVNRATLVTYSGAPDFPHGDRILRLIEDHRLTAIGISPSLIRALMSSPDTAARPLSSHHLRAFASSGEPWTSDAWWWLFRDVGREKLPIVNFTGGTEVGACFLSVSLLQGITPLSVGAPSLGMAVDIYSPDGSSTGGAIGELVCTQPWPAMARTVWGDHQRFLDTYWSHWPGVWQHGDRASMDAQGFWTLHGRSDDVMNVAGKRLGPVEVESAACSVPGITMAAAVGVPHPTKGEVIALFIVMQPDVELTDTLRTEIRHAVQASLGKAFAPAEIIAVPDLPRTRTAKTVRRAIRSFVLGHDPGDLSTVENPESLQAFPRLRTFTIP